MCLCMHTYTHTHSTCKKGLVWKLPIHDQFHPISLATLEHPLLLHSVARRLGRWKYIHHVL